MCGLSCWAPRSLSATAAQKVGVPGSTRADAVGLWQAGPIQTAIPHPCVLASFHVLEHHGEAGACDSCSFGSTSPVGSLVLSDCKPTVDGTWAECEPCASETPRNLTTAGDTLGIFANSLMPFCVNRVVLKIWITTFGSEVSWQFGKSNDIFGKFIDVDEIPDGYLDTLANGSFAHMYTDNDNANAHFHTIMGLSLAQHQHTLHFNDAGGDGWHEGFWHLKDARGGTIGGGPVEGLVKARWRFQFFNRLNVLRVPG